MPLLFDRTRSRSTLRRTDYITIGLINNMPEAAVEATERQFSDLLRAAATDVVVRLKLFSIPEVPRSDHACRELAERYCDVSELWDSRLDGLIVTGTEPRAARLTEEPYWAALSKVVDWAHQHTGSTIWSCLAAHAAVLYFEGIERHPLAEKCFGVFDYQKVADHPLTRAMCAPLRIPHST